LSESVSGPRPYQDLLFSDPIAYGTDKWCLRKERFYAFR